MWKVRSSGCVVSEWVYAWSVIADVFSEFVGVSSQTSVIVAVNIAPAKMSTRVGGRTESVTVCVQRLS